MHATTVWSPLSCRAPPVGSTGRQLWQHALPQDMACGRIRKSLLDKAMVLLAADHGLWAHQAASFDSYTASPDYPMRISEQAAGDNQFKVGLTWH